MNRILATGMVLLVIVGSMTFGFGSTPTVATLWDEESAIVGFNASVPVPDAVELDDEPGKPVGVATADIENDSLLMGAQSVEVAGTAVSTNGTNETDGTVDATSVGNESTNSTVDPLPETNTSFTSNHSAENVTSDGPTDPPGIDGIDSGNESTTSSDGTANETAIPPQSEENTTSEGTESPESDTSTASNTSEPEPTADPVPTATSTDEGSGTDSNSSTESTTASPADTTQTTETSTAESTTTDPDSTSESTSTEEPTGGDTTPTTEAGSETSDPTPVPNDSTEEIDPTTEQNSSVTGS